MPAKRPKLETSIDKVNSTDNYGHPVLKHYFEKVLTLREHLVSRLSTPRVELAQRFAEFGPLDRPEIASLLDSVTVGVKTNPSPRHTRAQDIAVFSQHLPASTLGSNSDPGARQQIEVSQPLGSRNPLFPLHINFIPWKGLANQIQQVVDFVIWLLFRRGSPGSKPQHLLCYGFERASAAAEDGPKCDAGPCIPGIVCQFSNPHVVTLTGNIWCELLPLLGRGGDLIMIDLLVDCGLFVAAQDGVNGLRQISGKGYHFGHS